MQVTVNEILAINGIKSFGNYKVRKIGEGVYMLLGYRYGKPEVLLKGFAEDVVDFLKGV